MSDADKRVLADRKPRRFRKKPVIIEAEQYRSDRLTMEGLCFCEAEDGKAHVHTAHAGQTVRLEDGDWIVPESRAPGRFYPIKADVFEATYDEVPDGI